MAKRKKIKRRHAEWLPWSLDDWDKEHAVDKALIAEAAQLAGIEKKRLEAEIRSIAATYWRDRREFDRPPEKWRVGRVNRLKRATERVLSLIRKQEGMACTRFR
jgi:hypothetical protein